MANKNKPHTNESQFFITLDKCSWLDKKHTIFGKVVGDTYYNVLTISELPTDKDDRPDFENPPKIIRCEVVINPFPDIFPRKKIVEGKDNKIVRKPKNENKMKNYEDKNLLSFEEGNDNETTVGKGIKAVHEMVKNDRKLVNKPVIDKGHLEDLKTYLNDKEENLKSIKEKVKNIKENITTGGINKIDVSDSDSSSSSSEKRSKKDTENYFVDKSTENKMEDVDKRYILENDELFSENKKEINNLRKEILKIKKRKEDPEEEIRLKEELKLYTPLQKYREKYLTKKKQRMAGRETSEKLKMFKEKLKTAEGDEDNWLSNKLKFHVDSQRAYAINENIAKQNTNSGVDAIEIIDPKKRFQRTNDSDKVENPQILNIDKMFNVEDLINNAKQNKN
jgi:peptidyl-prolyl cis-trans isomerase SDCCAG10